MPFQKATKEQSKGRIALIGPAGCGKTYLALLIAQQMGKKIALIDTEHGSASKYADIFSFDTQRLVTFSPAKYIEAIEEAEKAQYDFLIIDSLSHAWVGVEGCLEMVDKIAARSKSRNSFAAWRHVTPVHNRLVEAMLACKCHLIVTMRSKTEYVIEDDERGRKVPRKVGMAPIQRDGLEYEFDVVGDMDQENTLVISKSRCPELFGAVIKKPGEEFANTLLAWLSSGEKGKEPQRQTNKGAGRRQQTQAKKEPESQKSKKTFKQHFWTIFNEQYSQQHGGRKLPKTVTPEVISGVIGLMCDSPIVAKTANDTGFTPFWGPKKDGQMLPDDRGWETLCLSLAEFDLKKAISDVRRTLKKKGAA